MKSVISLILWFLFFFFGESVILTEIMFHHRAGESRDYLELYNPDSSPVDISSWKFVQGIVFTFPAGSSIAANSYIVVCDDKATIKKAYPYLQSEQVFGDYVGSLSNSKESLELHDQNSQLKLLVEYSDGWFETADGLGSSMELLCYESGVYARSNWRPSPMPTTNDFNLEQGGSPGKESTWRSCPRSEKAVDPVFISEIQYNPFNDKQELSEYIEFYNQGPAVDIGGWRVVSKEIKMRFPLETTIAAESYFVVHKKGADLTVPDGVSLFSFDGNLSNGKDTVAILDDNGEIVDVVVYDDEFPWPMGPDGNGDYSLSRHSFVEDGEDYYNWDAQKKTPGAVNEGLREKPLARAEKIKVYAADTLKDLIYDNERGAIEIRVDGPEAVTAVQVEYFVEDPVSGSVEKAKATVDAVLDGKDYIATIPGAAENKVVRYKIIVNSGGAFTTAPRDTDPYEFYGYFINPQFQTESRIYHLFITPARWEQLYNNLEVDRQQISTKASGCKLNLKWNNREPAVVALNGKVYDVEVRFGGSYFQRARGGDMVYNGNTPAWTGSPQPGRNVLAGHTWVVFPKYHKIRGRNSFILHKIRQGCSHYQNPLMHEVAKSLGLFNTEIDFMRLHVNGGYLRYGMDVSRPDDSTLADYREKMGRRCVDHAVEPEGNLFKSGGVLQGQEPFGNGDERKLDSLEQSSRCAQSWSPLQRYEVVYSRKSNKATGDHKVMESFINDLDAADKNGISDLTDVNALMNNFAFMNWAAAWDDSVHNKFYYQRATDGKWMQFPWDGDSLFGQGSSVGGSFEIGDTRKDITNCDGIGGSGFLKCSIIAHFRSQFTDRVRDISETFMNPTIMNAMLDKIIAKVNKTEMMNSPTEYELDKTMRTGASLGTVLNQCDSGIKNFFQQRYDYIKGFGSETRKTVDTCWSYPTVTKTFNVFRNVPGKPYPIHPTVGAAQVNLEWINPNSHGNPITSFQLQRKIDDGEFEDIMNDLQTSYKDSKTTGTKYSYRVLAENSVGKGKFSNPIEIEFGVTPTSTSTPVPTTSVPTTGNPTTGFPTTGSPTTGRPTTGFPTTGAGTGNTNPTTGIGSGPTTGFPTTGGPTTGSPTTGGPTTTGLTAPPIPPYIPDIESGAEKSLFTLSWSLLLVLFFAARNIL